jgi:hypothetical protein
VLSRTNATDQQVDEAIRVNSEARLRALKIGLVIMGCIGALAILPASRLPPYRPGEIPDNRPPQLVYDHPGFGARS